MFEDAHPLEVLRWAGAEFGDGLVVTASFADPVLVHLVSRAIPDADVVLLDTGYLFSESEWYAERLRRELGLKLRILHPAPDAVPDQWMTDTNACCHARKVEPLERALAGKSAWVTGLRRADSPTRATTPIVHTDLLRGVTKINPIAAWTDDDMEHYAAMELLPAHPLADRGYPSIGCWPCTRPVAAGEDPRSGPVGRERQDRVRAARMTTVEDVKRASGFLRGELAEQLVDGTDRFGDDSTVLLKFHGIYQQDDRDVRRARASQKLPLDYSCMVRASVPGGKLTADQWLALDRVADLADGTMRLTTRQGVQFHMVHKGALRELVAGINSSLLTTLAACGDVVRNIMGSPWPDSRQEVDRAVGRRARCPLPPADPVVLAALGRRGTRRDRAAGAAAVPRSAGPQALARADLRRCVPAAEVQDHRRLAGRQQRRRAGQRRRHRADAVRWAHGRR